jgi:uncharacterized phage-like protein YoqJ
MEVAVTGHRPEKLGGYSESVHANLVRFAREILGRAPKENVAIITGMALGWDIAIAQACDEDGIPFIAAVPCDDQEAIWEPESQNRYRRLLLRAQDVHVVSPGPFALWKMQARNKWMVDRCKAVIALWDGSGGGTKNCVDYAQRKGVMLVNVWDEWVKFALRNGYGRSQ